MRWTTISPLILVSQETLTKKKLVAGLVSQETLTKNPFSVEYSNYTDAEMSKTFVSAGIIALLIGIVLIALPYVYVPKTVSEPYQAVRSSAILDETFTLGNDRIIHTVYLNKGELVNIQIAVNGEGAGEATFMVFDDSAIYIQEHGANFTYNRNWTAPLSANYSFMYVKDGLYTPAITVTELVTKIWAETAYRDVTTSCRLLSFEFLYLGVVLTFVGLGLLVYFKKRKR